MKYQVTQIAEEQEADRFATELLMPEAYINKECAKLNLDYIDIDSFVAMMANKFKVSRVRMALRLSELKIIKP